MNGLLRRLRRARAAGDGEAPPPEPGAAPNEERTTAPSLFADPPRGERSEGDAHEGGAGEPRNGGAVTRGLAGGRHAAGGDPREREAAADRASAAPGDESGAAAQDARPARPGAAAQDARPAPPDPGRADTGAAEAGVAAAGGDRPQAEPAATGGPGAAAPQAGEPALGAAGGATPPPQRDPNVPAGLDPAEAAARPPAGRRGRLRRRLRYLRRARELMLRDLGGLVYEVHRTGGGDLPAHAGLVGAKVQRLLALDAEAHGLEAALSAPREQVVLFEPGVGGTCEVCGELYPSDARFCSNCGTPAGGAADAAPAPTRAPDPPAEPIPASERAPTLAGPIAEPVVPIPEPPPAPAAPGAEAATSVLPAARGEDTQSLPAAVAERRDEERAGDRANAAGSALRDETPDGEEAPVADTGRLDTAGPAAGHEAVASAPPTPARAGDGPDDAAGTGRSEARSDAQPTDADQEPADAPPTEADPLAARERRG